MNNQLNARLDAFLAANERNMVEDIKTLLNIKSVAAPSAEGAPFGEGVRRALDAALEIASREGFYTENLDNRIGIVHMGDEDSFIGMVAHLDVVPEGDGWDTDPFCCVEREGYLLARGSEDNKSPFIMCLYAMKFLRESGVPLRYGMRLLAGCDEETGMSDIRYYLARKKAPLFTFIPDSEFPVGHGEKGIQTGNLVSKKPLSDKIIELRGGVASNVIPERAYAVVNARLANCPKAENIAVTGEDGSVRIEAQGIAAHASRPVGSRNAIIMLYKYLIDNGIADKEDSAVLGAVADALDVDYGEKLGIASDDGIFTPLTCITGMAEKNAVGSLSANLNIRYPTSITGKEIIEKISAYAAAHGFEYTDIHDDPTHFIPADSAAVRTLSEVFAAVTGKRAEPYVMSGGTYARHIPNAVTFGCHFEDEIKAPFVGTIHGKNEGIAIDTIMKATRIYALSLAALQEQTF